jgi:hypothetical protein
MGCDNLPWSGFPNSDTIRPPLFCGGYGALGGPIACTNEGLALRGWAMKGVFTLGIYIAIGITDAALGQLKAPSVFDYATAPVPISTNRPPSSDGWLPPDQRTPENVALQPKPPATAAAQQSTHYKNVPAQAVIDPEAGVPLYKRKYMAPEGSLDWLPDGARIVATIKPPPLPAPERIVIAYEMGGLLAEHTSRFYALGQTGAPVEIRGGCWSACTMITAFIPKERLCFAPGAFLAFHAARTVEPYPRLSPHATWTMYASYPAEIRQWIDDRGGPNKLTVETFWTMDDRELWAMGYPKCK